MAAIHFLNVLDGDCNIIQHDSGRVSLIDVSNAYNGIDTAQEKAAKKVKDEVVKKTNYVPDGKINYLQKETPDNPIDYLNKLKVKEIFRFIITHPDMDHLDGIEDLFSEFSVANTWFSANSKTLAEKDFPAKYNPDDWKFYANIRDGKYSKTKSLSYNDGDSCLYFNEDNIKILAPSPGLVTQANKTGEMHDLSYVLLCTFPKKGGGVWKVIFAGDSHDNTWEYILKTYKKDIENIDVLFAPHHGRDSKRSYDFLKVINPKVTLFGNASSEHLAYTSYTGEKITNNQAGHVIVEITQDYLRIMVKHKPFAVNYRARQNWEGDPAYYSSFDAFGLFQYNANNNA